MKLNSKEFAAGVLAGLAISAFLVFALMGRYSITSSGPGGVLIIKLDRWTGKTFKFWQGTWEPIQDSN